MITIETARRNLLRIVLALSAAILILGFAIDLLLQKRTEMVTTESAVVNSWLLGQMSYLNDAEISELWSKIRTKLQSYDTFFAAPENVVSGQSLIEPKDFIKSNRDNDSSKSYWTLNPSEPGIDTNFNFALSILSKDFAPTADEIAQDRIRYERVMGTIISAFARKQTKDLSPIEYSERMLDFFDIKELAKSKMPGLSIQWIYMASTKGTFAMYPASNQSLHEYNLRTRPWFTSVIDGKPTSENIIPESPGAFGLVPFYADYLSKGYTRTFWHRISAKGVDYVICVDLVLTPKDLRNRNDFFDNIPPVKSSAIGGGGYLRAFKVGTVSGLTFLILGVGFTLLGGSWSSALARRLITAKISSKETETGDRFRPIFRALAARDRSRSIHSEASAGTSSIRKTGFTAMIVMNVAKLEHETQRVRQRTSTHTVTESMNLENLDNDIHTRGIEKWEIYRRKGQWVGRCRLCSQEVQYQDKEVRIGEVTIKHGIDPKPDVSLNIDTHWHSTDSPTIKNSVIWQVLDTQTKHLGEDYELKPYPPPRVPQEPQVHSFAREILDKYRLLNEGRYETDDSLEISKELFRNRDVRSACTLTYLQHLIDLGDSGLAVLREGNDIERILIADTQDLLNSFVLKNRNILMDLLTRRKNLQLYTVSLDKMRIAPIETYPELDFALAYGTDDFKYLIISHPASRMRGSNMRGYVSWREVDISFCETLFERLKDFKQSLKIDDLRTDPGT